jgi:hypothetical protein
MGTLFFILGVKLRLAEPVFFNIDSVLLESQRELLLASGYLNGTRCSDNDLANSSHLLRIFWRQTIEVCFIVLSYILIKFGFN